MTLTFPWPPKELSPNARVHWAARARATKRYRAECGWIARESKATAPDGFIEIRVTFCPPNRKQRDRDNMQASIKALFDGLADALGVNDSRFIPRYEVSDQIAGKVIVEIAV